MEGTKPRTVSSLGMFDLLKGIGMLAIVFAHTAELYPLGTNDVTPFAFALFAYREALMEYLARKFFYCQRLRLPQALHPQMHPPRSPRMCVVCRCASVRKIFSRCPRPFRFADAMQRRRLRHQRRRSATQASPPSTTARLQQRRACPLRLVSRSRCAACQAEARDPKILSRCVDAGGEAQPQPRSLPPALAHYEWDICAEDVWSVKGKRVFIMSHLLDMTGAPIVLVSAEPVLRSMGYEVVVLGPEDGGSMPLFLEAGATVITRKGL